MNRMTNRLLSLSLWVNLLCSPFLHAGNGDPIRCGNACDRPELLQADQITDVSARLIWADVGDEYQVELVEQGQVFSGVPTYYVPNDPPYDVGGLTPGRNYKFQVRTVCGGTEFSEWSTPRNFSTELNNRVPCPLSFDLRDTTCISGGQFFRVHVDNAPGAALGTDVLVRGVRLMIEHP
ncbi:MAG TPA: fibronectin type III domain-containing protein, partial [Saprospiraceae bacterium]|nr:fibronectin type III domain-containing protein [Saprospiraceae bacterium]